MKRMVWQSMLTLVTTSVLGLGLSSCAESARQGPFAGTTSSTLSDSAPQLSLPNAGPSASNGATASDVTSASLSSSTVPSTDGSASLPSAPSKTPITSETPMPSAPLPSSSLSEKPVTSAVIPQSSNSLSTQGAPDGPIPTWTYDAACLSPQPLANYVQEVRTDSTMSWITGTVTATNQTILSPSDGHLVLTRLTVQVDSVVAGQKLSSEPLEVYVAGGTFQEEARAVTGPTGAISWGPDGRFFGTVFKSASVPSSAYKLISLPMLDSDTIVSPDVGCIRFSASQGAPAKGSIAVFQNGSQNMITGTFPSQSLAALSKQVSSMR